MRSHQASRGLAVWSVCLVFLGLLALGGCTVKLVADYDTATYEEILRVGKDVDKFYGSLLEAPENTRSYKNYAEKYVDLEATIRSLYVRNLSRPLNKESTRITKIILDLWIKTKNLHQANTKKTYSTGNAEIDREKFQDLFMSAATAEEAKKPGLGDKDSRKDSK